MTLNTTLQPNIYCTFLLQKSVPDAPSVKAAAIATTILNAVTSIVAVLGNGCILHLLAKHHTLQTPTNILFGNLSISDLIVGKYPTLPNSVMATKKGSYSNYVLDSNIKFTHVALICRVGAFGITYFKGRNFCGQKLSRGSKIEKFREFKFRAFHVMKKIHGKNFRDF